MFEDFFDSENQRERFRIISNKLLNHCFLIKKKEDTKSDYFFLMQNVSKFKDFFDLIGYDIVVDQTQCVVGLKNRYGTGRYQFSKIESIVLLILRLLFLEKKDDISSLSDDVIVTMEEINEKYNAIDVKGKSTLDKVTERNVMALFKRMNLILNLDRDFNQSECRIMIFPSILMAVPVEKISECYEVINDKLAEYKGDLIYGTDSDDVEESSDETAPD